MEKLVIPLAYKYVALVVMLAEINYCAKELQLPAELPVTPQALETRHVSKPFVTGFGGTLETDQFSFVFFQSGRLREVTRLNRFEKIPLRELYLKQSQMTSLVNSNEAYQLATNWLAAISIDVASLERSLPHQVEQRFFYPDATSIDDPPEKLVRKVWLPIFEVTWGSTAEPAVFVSIFGPTRELLRIRQNDDSFSQRPKDLLKDVDALLAIPDQEFLKYSADERQKLVARFAAVDYAQSTNTNSPAAPGTTVGPPAASAK